MTTFDVIKITKSKLRRALFQLYFADPEKKYYLRELERIIHFPVQNIRQELLLLKKIGIFKSEKQGNLMYYFLNKEFLLYEELKSIIFKTIGVNGALKKELKKIKGIKQAFIFGSFAKNKEDSLSDIDLMIIGDIDEDLLISKISKLEDVLRREINYNIFSAKDFKDGLKKKEVFLEEIMANPKIFIIGNQNDLEKIL